ncbi:MAG: hypothetical protein JO235_03125 [Chroococcidiopsidaceae cyanobacterium CP_BM_RX_35]|nr:hypothetical protein [Chroococcidiopsidaceae cyanobacterium CP_BM_RX_35]
MIYQEILQQGRQEGLQEGLQREATLVLRLLARRQLGQLTPEVRSPLGQRFAIADPAT